MKTAPDKSRGYCDWDDRREPFHLVVSDTASVEFPAASFDTVISYKLEHILWKEQEILLRRMCLWLRAEGLLLISMEAGEYDDVMGEWLGVPM